MGQTSNFVLIILAIELFTGMIALGIMSVDPTSQLLLGNKLFGNGDNPNDNLVVSNINNDSGVYTYDYNEGTFDGIGTSNNTVVSSSNSVVVDWIGAGWKYIIDAGRSYINLVGAPFTILSSIGLDSELSALIGSFFGIFGTFIFLNWILGRDN